MKIGEFNDLLKNLKEKCVFDKFYSECFPLLIKYSNYIYSGKNLGYDIAQDIFHYLLTHENSTYVRSPRVWLFTLCKNFGLKYLTNDVELNESASYTSFVEHYDLGELDYLLDGLSPAERELIELKHIAGFSLKEIAAIKNKTYASVLKQHYRILKKLEKKLSKNS